MCPFLTRLRFQYSNTRADRQIREKKSRTLAKCAVNNNSCSGRSDITVENNLQLGLVGGASAFAPSTQWKYIVTSVANGPCANDKKKHPSHTGIKYMCVWYLCVQLDHTMSTVVTHVMKWQKLHSQWLWRRTNGDLVNDIKPCLVKHFYFRWKAVLAMDRCLWLTVIWPQYSNKDATRTPFL